MTETDELACPHGCGRTFTTRGGQAGHARSCPLNPDRQPKRFKRETCPNCGRRLARLYGLHLPHCHEQWPEGAPLPEELGGGFPGRDRWLSTAHFFADLAKQSSDADALVMALPDAPSSPAPDPLLPDVPEAIVCASIARRLQEKYPGGIPTVDLELLEKVVAAVRRAGA